MAAWSNQSATGTSPCVFRSGIVSSAIVLEAAIGARQLLAGEHVLAGLVEGLHRDQPALPVSPYREGARLGALVAHFVVTRHRETRDLQTRLGLVTPEAWDLRVRVVTQTRDVVGQVGPLVGGVLHAPEPQERPVDALEGDVAHGVDR